MRDTYYKIRMENGIITLLIFDRDNPIPIVKYKGKLNSEKTKIFLDEMKNRIDDLVIKRIVNTIVEN